MASEIVAQLDGTIEGKGINPELAKSRNNFGKIGREGNKGEPLEKSRDRNGKTFSDGIVVEPTV